MRKPKRLQQVNTYAKKKVNILVVDDESGIRDVFYRLLKPKGYKVDTARDGYEAIDKAKKITSKGEKYQIAFIDLVLPGLNGVETLYVLKKYNPKMVAVMMTGYAVEDIVREALELDVYAIINKPFTLKKILDTISRIPGGGEG